MRVVVRQVETPRDANDIEDVATHCHNDHGCGRSFDAREIGKHVFICVQDPQRKYINGWVAYDEQDQPIGYMVATMRQSLFSQRSYAIQEMWYVLPSARRSLAGVLLLHAFERWALERNAERIYMQVEHDSDWVLTERVVKLMQSMGYKKQGYICVKTFNEQQEKEVEDDRTAHRSVGAEQA